MLPDVKLKKLDNGVTLLSQNFSWMDTVDIIICIGSGSNDENNNFGISHFVEHMCFQSNELLNSNERLAYFDKNAKYVNGSTSEYYTTYSVTTLSDDDHLKDVLKNTFAMFTKNKLLQEEIDKEKDIIITEIEAVFSDPYSLAFHMLHKNIRKLDINKLGPIGSIESIIDLKSDDLREFINDRYIAPNITISVAGGNYNLDMIIDIIYENFPKIDPTKIKNINNPRDSFDISYNKMKMLSGIDHVNFDSSNTSEILISGKMRPIDCIKGRDSIIIRNILGFTPNSRLFRTIRNELGLCYSVSMWSYQDIPEHGGYYIYATVLPDNLVQTQSKILNMMADIRSNGISEKEFIDTITMMKSDFRYCRSNLQSMASSNLNRYIKFGKPISDEELSMLYDLSSLDGINSTIKEMFDPNRLCTVIVN